MVSAKLFSMTTDPLIRDIALIKRYSRHNEAEDFRFRDFLKTGLPLSNAALDLIVKEITDEVWSGIDCLACGNCCKTLQVVLDEEDIARLSRRLQLTEKEFKKRFVRLEPDRTLVFKGSPCPLLGEDNRCSVYEDRPKACHDFPYLHNANFRSRSLMMIESTSTCPIVFNVWSRLKKRLQTRKR